MVTHPWYVLHIPFTDIYVPPWTIAGILVLILAAVAFVAVIVRLNQQKDRTA